MSACSLPDFRLAYYIPIYALINLFIHILQAPGLPSVQSDALLMEIGASHFLRVELVSESQIFTPFVKDIARMARNVIERPRSVEHDNPPNSGLNADESALTTLSTSGPVETTTAQDETNPEEEFYTVSEPKID